MAKSLTKYETEYFITPNDKRDVKITRDNIDDVLKEYTQDIYTILSSNLDGTTNYKIKYIKNKKGNLASIEVSLQSSVNYRYLDPSVFVIKILYHEGLGPIIDVECENHCDRFKFEILERNFLNQLMQWYNDKTGKEKFSLKPGKYDWKKYLLYDEETK